MRPRSALLLPALLWMSACSLPAASQRVDGPAFELDADEPVAAFSVELCISGPALDFASARAQVNATVRGSGSAATVLGQALDAESVEGDAYDPHSDEVRVDGAEVDLGWWLVTEDGPWSGGGRRCQEVQTAQFELEEGYGGGAVAVEWEIVFDVEYDDGLFGGSTLDSDDLEIVIERL